MSLSSFEIPFKEIISKNNIETYLIYQAAQVTFHS